jgi:hypothetical protein
VTHQFSLRDLVVQTRDLTEKAGQAGDIPGSIGAKLLIHLETQERSQWNRWY